MRVPVTLLGAGALVLLLGATDQQPEKGSVSVVPAVSPTHTFPIAKATNGNVTPVLVDDAGAVVLSNPGAGGGGGTSANVQDAGIAFNRSGSNTLGVATNGVSFPVLLDDAGAVVISNPGAGGGGGTVIQGAGVNGTPWLVYFDGGTVGAIQSGTWTVQPGNTANTTAWKVDNSAVTQPISALAVGLNDAGQPTSSIAIGGLDTTGILTPVAVDAKNHAIFTRNFSYLPNNATCRTPTSVTSASCDGGFAANACLWILCDTDSFFSTGTGNGAPVAVNDGGAPMLKAGTTLSNACMTGGANAIGFSLASGTGNCWVSVVPSNQ